MSSRSQSSDTLSAPLPTPVRPAPTKRSRARAGVPPVPLGSLTQRTDRREALCRGCGSTRVTQISLSLTDGTPVEFVSCHRCEHRTWESSGQELPVETVLERSRKILP